jgi:isopenicillin N synthase-like dioxygenase
VRLCKQESVVLIHFKVNLGDMLARMSNDLFVSTVHRAVNRTGVERFSCPVFVGPAYGGCLAFSAF